MFTALALQTMLLAYPAPRDREPPDKGPGFLGIAFEAADPLGVRITDVRPQGPAEKSGLRAQDIIRKFDGQPIDFNSFARKIIRVRPGTVVPVEVQRGGSPTVIKVKIGLRPDDFPYAPPSLEDSPPTIQPVLPPVLQDPLRK